MELSENLLQNLFLNLTPQTVLELELDLFGNDSADDVAAEESDPHQDVLVDEVHDAGGRPGHKAVAAVSDPPPVTEVAVPLVPRELEGSGVIQHWKEIKVKSRRLKWLEIPF